MEGFRCQLTSSSLITAKSRLILPKYAPVNQDKFQANHLGQKIHLCTKNCIKRIKQMMFPEVVYYTFGMQTVNTCCRVCTFHSVICNNDRLLQKINKRLVKNVQQFIIHLSFP